MSVLRKDERRLVTALLCGPLLICDASSAAAEPTQPSASSPAAPDFLRLTPIPLAKLALPGRTSITLAATIRDARVGLTADATSQRAFSRLSPIGQVDWDDGSRPLGEISSVRYGAGALTLVSKPRLGRWRPYVGAGLSYHFEKHSTPLRNFEVKDSLGPVFESGLEFQMLRSGRLFADAKKGFFTSNVIGEVQGVRSITASRFNPLILTLGAAARF